MGQNLYLQTGKKKCLSKGLKILLGPRLYDGSFGGNPMVIDYSNTEYLKGLRDALPDGDERRDELQQILDAVDKYDEAYLVLQ